MPVTEEEGLALRGEARLAKALFTQRRRIEIVLYGGTGNDTLYGGRGDDSVGGEGICDQENTAPDGDDTLDGGPGEDQLSDGSSGNDTLEGGTEHDELHANSGNDILRGGELVDDMWGGYGDDTLYGSGDDGFSDYLNCQEGTNDVAYAGAGPCL